MQGRLWFSRPSRAAQGDSRQYRLAICLFHLGASLVPPDTGRSRRSQASSPPPPRPIPRRPPTASVREREREREREKREERREIVTSRPACPYPASLSLHISFEFSFYFECFPSFPSYVFVPSFLGVLTRCSPACLPLRCPRLV